MRRFEVFQRNKDKAIPTEENSQKLPKTFQDVTQTEPSQDYLRLRAETLAPDLREEVRLELEERNARQLLDAARSKVERLKGITHLEAQIRARAAQRPGAERGAFSNSDAELREAEASLANHEQALKGLTEEFSACRERIQAKDNELRNQFGIAESRE